MMDQSDYSNEDFGSSDEEIQRVKPSARSIMLRTKARKSYKELEGSDDDDGEEFEEEEEDVQVKNEGKIQNSNLNLDAEDGGENEEVFQENGEENFNEEQTGIFHPEIDQILWRRDKFLEDDSRTVEYLIKFKEYSYLHVQWMEEGDLMVTGKNIKNKLNRFNKTFDKKLIDLDETDVSVLDSKFFDPSFVEVDRIIYCTELFPIIHPKKANEIKGKWNEYIAQVASKLINFTKNNIHYGVYFMDPVDPDRDGVPNYRKIIQTPMDFGTCINRIYLDYYKSGPQFWAELGLIFKNCRKFNKDPNADIRILCDTLREAALELYKQWFAFMKERYDKFSEEFREKQKNQKEETPVVADEKDEIKKQTELEFKTKENEIQNILSQFESYQNKTFMSSTSNPQQLQFQLTQFISSNPHMFPTKLSLDEIAKMANLKPGQGSANSNNPAPTTAPVQQQQETPNPSMPVKKLEIPNMLKTKGELKAEQNMTHAELEAWNPGPYTFAWAQDDKATTNVEEEEGKYLGEEDLKQLDLFAESEKLYLVKWKNLSYSESTWECESTIANPQKINDFRFFNRALDKESRQLMINQVHRHKTYMDILNNPKKKAKCSPAFLNDLKNKLYHYDVALHREPIQYTFKNQPIFKDQKMLRDYQLESLNWLIQAWYSKRNVILADEMGLGKTIQSIAFLNHLNNFEGCRGPFLIIAPLSTLEHWKRTAEDWTNLNAVLYYDTGSIEGRAACRGYEWFYIDVSTKGSLLHTAELYKFQIIITSYEVFLQDLNLVFLSIPFQFIVVDEAHRLKNTNAKILGSLKRLACKRILLLTGTPIQNNTEELWSLLNYIEPDKFPSAQQFLYEFGDLSKADQVEKLHKILKPYLLRRRKEEVEQSIPPLQETIIDVEMTTTQKTIYRALYERNKSLLSKGLTNTNFTTSLNNLEMQLRKCCNHPFLIKEIELELTKECVTSDEKMKKMVESSGKMILLNKLLPKMKNENKKVLIFSQFTQMLLLLEDYLSHYGYKYEKIDGAVKSKERQNAIDRFNDPTKKRDVFLLSTKAGGLGINLTSANVVIIYDSDWNPQNDVQATARAHRIGQQSEVLVYRLITAKTYESEMFQRASKKLGLDQAIFMGGAFQSTGEENKNRDKMSKQEIETLLKKGILGLITDDNDESKTFMEKDIDEILSSNTHKASYSLIKGTYTFQKSSFVSEKADVNVAVDDPNFWDVVLKNTDSVPKQLLNEFDTNKLMQKDYNEQKKYMIRLNDTVSKVIENKLNVVGYNADDEKNVMDILNKISNSKVFHKNYRAFALQWAEEVMRPSRRARAKKLSPSEFEIGKSTLVPKTDAIPRTRNAAKKEDQGSDEEQIFNEDGDEGQLEEEFHNFEEEDEDDETLANKKLSNKLKEELLKKLCHYCERSKASFFCQGFCKRAFHEICKNKIEEGTIAGLDDNVIGFDVPETKLDEERLKKNMNLEYICKDCTKNLAICFKCKKKGSFYPELSSSKSKSKSKSGEDKDDSATEGKESSEKIKAEFDAPAPKDGKKSNDLIKCSTANCNKFFHLSCISDNPLFKFFDANKHKKFRCSLHYCAKCKISGDTMTIAQCFRCPKAYHLKCYPKDKVLKVNKKVIICQDHKFETKSGKDKDDDKKKGKDKGSTQLKIEKGNDNKMVIKMSKIDERDKPSKDEEEEDDLDDFKIQKNKKGKRRLEKLERKKFESEKRNERLIYLDFKIGEDTVINGMSASISSKFRRKLDLGAEPIIKVKRPEKEKLTYADLQIQTPEEFDYENYDRDWCRYCGARYSSNFTKGPWGSRTLCTIHYIDWNQKKTLNLSSSKDLPKRPIKVEANTELSYLQKMLAKTDKEYTPEMLESLKPTKKVKKNEVIENAPEEGEVVRENGKDDEDKRGDGLDEELQDE